MRLRLLRLCRGAACLLQGRPRRGSCAHPGEAGHGLRGACIGVGLTTEADVSLVPEAEGESIGFRDARIERLSESRELNFLLVPFLSRKLPSRDEGECRRPDAQSCSASPCTSTGYTSDAGFAEAALDGGRPRRTGGRRRRQRSRPLIIFKGAKPLRDLRPPMAVLPSAGQVTGNQAIRVAANGRFLRRVDRPTINNLITFKCLKPSFSAGIIYA